MSKQYQHTQIGWLMIVAFGGVALLILFLMAVQGPDRVLLIVPVIALAVIALSLGLVTTLTTEIDREVLEVRFGPIGIIRKRFPLREIVSCQVVRNRWYYGWGIRWTPHGWLYNVSGLDAVELQMRTGKKHRVGTDVPDEGAWKSYSPSY